MKHHDTLTADLFGGMAGSAVLVKPSPPPVAQPVPLPVTPTQPTPPPERPPAQPAPPSTSARETQARARLRAQRETPTAAPQAPASVSPQATIASIAAVSKPPTPAHDVPVPQPPTSPRKPIALFPLVALIACGCFALSAVNTLLFLLQSGKPLPLAAATAVLTTAFSGAAFHFGKTYRNPLCYALAAGIIAFSVFASIAVSYDQLKAQELTAAPALEYLQETATLRAVNAQELETTQAEITRLTVRIADLHRQAAYWQDKSWNRYDAARADLSAVEARITDLQVQTTALQAEAKRIAGRNSTSAQLRGQSVYAFVSTITGVDENLLRFLIFCIPAVFFDLASPLMLALLWRNFP